MSADGTAITLAELLALRGWCSDRHYGRAVAVAPLPGGHRAQAAGQGLEFAGSRPYVPGDDPRSMDWRQTARRGRPYTRLLQDEREWPLWLLVDQGQSMHFATRVAYKSVIAARAAALLAWQAVGNSDRLGGVVFDGARVRLAPARRGSAGVLGLLRTLAVPADEGDTSPSRGGLHKALDAIATAARPGSRLEIVSDFYALDGAGAAPLCARIRALARRYHLRLLHVFDPIEDAGPPSGVFPVLAGNRRLFIDLASPLNQTAFSAPHRERCRILGRLARETGAAYLALPTDGALDHLLATNGQRFARNLAETA